MDNLLRALFLFMISFILFFFADIYFAKEIPIKGIILDKSFTNGSTSYGHGTTTDGNTTTITTFTPDEWCLVVNIDSLIETVTCDAHLFYNSNIGDTITVIIHDGIVYKSISTN